MKKVEITAYTLRELKDANPRAFEKLYTEWASNYHFEIFESPAIAKLVEDFKVMYDNSYCQGSGLCFTGTIYPREDIPNPEWVELQNFINAIKKLPNDLVIKITHNSRYYHEKSVDIDFYGAEYTNEDFREFKEAYEELCINYFKDLQKWEESETDEKSFLFYGEYFEEQFYTIAGERI